LKTNFKQDIIATVTQSTNPERVATAGLTTTNGTESTYTLPQRIGRLELLLDKPIDL
jgi:hypothetical protein